MLPKKLVIVFCLILFAAAIALMYAEHFGQSRHSGDISRLQNFHTGTIYVEFFGHDDFLKFLGTREKIAEKFLQALETRAGKYFPQEKLAFKLNSEGTSFGAHPLDLGIQLNVGAATSARTVFTAQIFRSKYFDHYQNFLSSHKRGEQDVSLTPAIAKKFLKGENSLNFLTKTIKFETADIRENGSIPLDQIADWIFENMKPHANEARQAEQYLKTAAGVE
ncbi:MAG: hypothetical protein K0R10_2023 [Alphaproteobacteria bacterium]|jgi:hypothetical protein|nr:hypothetical protein [Alphaproteobacteria bacterium]